MTENLLLKKQEIEERRLALGKIRYPVITKRELLSGIHTRPRRFEIRRYKREVIRQKQFYEKQLKSINKYLESLKKNGEINLTKPKIFIKPFPKMRRVRRVVRRLY